MCQADCVVGMASTEWGGSISPVTVESKQAPNGATPCASIAHLIRADCLGQALQGRGPTELQHLVHVQLHELPLKRVELLYL